MFIIIVYLLLPSNSGEYDTFASCLTDKGIVMYGTDWCPHCKNQKEMFGDSFKKIKYVNCDINKEECAINRITGYPTWKIGNEYHSGVQPVETLASLSGCELFKDL